MSAAEEGLCLVHLVWAPLGPEALARFIDSYREHPAGAEHRLLIVMKGFKAGEDRGRWEQALEGVAHESMDTPTGMLDLGTYRSVVDAEPYAERYCFTNSSAVVLADNWLALLDRHLSTPGTGIAAVAGSHESLRSAAPRPLRPFRLGFDRFPNPHVRTNGFMMRRELVRALDWPAPRRKLQALRLESGKHGISRQVRDRGLALVIVGRDGAAYPVERWRESATYRSGNQENLLLADTRTRQFDDSSPKRRLHLEEMTWGPLPEPRPA